MKRRNRYQARPSDVWLLPVVFAALVAAGYGLMWIADFGAMRVLGH